jgi:hypothetical protein
MENVRDLYFEDGDLHVIKKDGIKIIFDLHVIKKDGTKIIFKDAWFESYESQNLESNVKIIKADKYIKVK